MGGGPAGPRTARLINDRHAYQLIRTHGPLTRAELTNFTGLSRPSVGELVSRLSEDGLIAVVGEAGTDRRGPKALLYGVVADRAYAAGVEIRSEMVSAVLVDMAGREVGRAGNTPTEQVSPDRLVGATLEEALRVAGAPPARLEAVAIGVPGVVDPRSGELDYTAGLPRWQTSLLPQLRTRFDASVVLENEVNLAGQAEQRLGAAADRGSFALLWLGDGVGVAIVLDGRLHRGTSGGAGEVAYAPVNGDVPVPRTAGGEGVRKLAAQYGLPVDAPLEELVTAGRTIPELATALTDAVTPVAATVCSILDPGLLVLGGPIGRAGDDWLADAVAARMRRRLPYEVRVSASRLDGNPVLRGAVLAASDTVHDRAFAP